ncbi:orphan sodium- and chloride-dependent neurotransmitter transporter NTT5 [Sorex araneus]|uniref:orphan sodium- and chloride-dependent neurotransmitter transporter NTT5 n=1 Tax=Sorex araneus TaxID=42254 RepID=UPI00243395F4|nr:orphan sodium- and chloride-dependent neurotransmitter transporter NTT5 [Sorex araneus]
MQMKDDEAFIRPFWSNKTEYIMAQVGYSLKPLNLWHFPLLWLHNGSGTFFIIYSLMMFLIGVPLLFLEMATGQRMQRGPIVAWKATSLWIGGLGYSSFVLCFITSIYMNVINVWTLFYLSQSIQYPLPWEQCPLLKNSSGFDPVCARTTPSMYFWYWLTLKAPDKLEMDGSPNLHLILPLTVTCLLLGIFTCNGLKFMGKIMTFFVMLPYVIIFCFLIRSLLLEGITFGLQYLMVSRISALYNISVWWQAGNQVLYTLGLGLGSIVSMSSHIPQNNSCLNDVIIMVLLNLFTTLLYTAFVFSILGFWATVITHRCFEKNAELLVDLVIQGRLPPEAKPPPNLNENPINIFTSWLNRLSEPLRSTVISYMTECSREQQFLKVKEGSEFAFLVFTETMSFIPGSVLLSIVFLILLLCLGLGNVLGTMQGIMIPLQDSFTSCRKHRKLFFDFMFCPGLLSVIMFLFGLFFIQPSGFYYFRLLNDFWIPIPILIFTVLEDLAVAWVYRTRRFSEELACLSDSAISPIYYWLLTWITPVVLLGLFVTAVIRLSSVKTYTAWDVKTSEEVLQELPYWSKILMTVLIFIIIIPITTCLLYCLIHKIPFSHQNSVTPSMSSKCLSLNNTPLNDIKKEEVSQDQIADPSIVTS